MEGMEERDQVHHQRARRQGGEVAAAEITQEGIQSKERREAKHRVIQRVIRGEGD